MGIPRLALFWVGATALLQGCAPLILAGAGTAAVAAHDRRTLGAFIDDQTIETKIAAAIRADQELRTETHVNVTSVNGIALLSGEAATAELRDRVLGKVREVGGVRRTVNEIRLAPPAPLASRSQDTWLTGKVRAALVGIENFDSTHVKIVTESGAVYLMGLVTQREGELATDAARNVQGIARVVKLFEYVD